MTSRVEILQLGTKDDDQYNDTQYHTGVNLDFDMITQYKGDGMCREVHCNCLGFGKIYQWINEDKIANTWAEKMNWDINEFRKNGYSCLLTRKKDVSSI